MNMFERFVYSMITSRDRNCLPPEECPAIKAECDKKSAQDVLILCEQCWNKLNKKQR